MIDVAKYGKGAIHSPDHRDYAFGASEPFDWSKPISFNVPLVATNQGGSSSCVGQATMNMAKISHFLKNGTLKNFSARFIYSQIYIPSGGAYGRDGMNVLVDQGIATESTYPSPPESETHMREQTGLNAAKIEAKQYDIYDGQAYVSVDNFNIDEVARAIRDTGSCMILAMGSNEGWSSPNVKPPIPGQSIWGHAVCGVQPIMKNGKRTIKFINSWDTFWGENGYGYINEDYFNQRSISACFSFTENFVKPIMEFQKISVTDKRIFAVINGKRYWILDPATHMKLNPAQNVTVNQNLKDVPYNGALFDSGTDDPFSY